MSKVDTHLPSFTFILLVSINESTFILQLYFFVSLKQRLAMVIRLQQKSKHSVKISQLYGIYYEEHCIFYYNLKIM